ncbi:MAG: HutD family protein [Lachnospiraceae bacterium]|nr:HutD family protein [Lachnospiraceae bacterium]
MKCRIIREAEYITTQWAGGKTSQIMISPQDAAFAERMFEWRFSRATVEAQESIFTKMQGFHRILYLISGKPELHYGGGTKRLEQGMTISFDGNMSIHALGQGTDLNLIMNVNTEGYVEQKRAAAGEVLLIKNIYAADCCMIYILSGQINVSGHTAYKHESIVCSMDIAEGFSVNAEESSEFVCFYIGKKGVCDFPAAGDELL